MLKFYHGTQLEKLADRLLEELDGSPPENLLAPETFVVQNHGVGQWLSLYMAENTKEGIAANLEFEFPSERIWKLIRIINPGIPQTLPSDRGPMTWSLMELLQDGEILSTFGNLRHYVQDDDPGQQAMRTWKLSTKIADVFDQYLIYRPEMILEWEKSGYSCSSGTERWQRDLWNRLVSHWQEDDDEAEKHRAWWQQNLLDTLEKGSSKFDNKELPSRLTVFGISAMPPPFIKAMVRLSEWVDVCVYQLTVNPEITDAAAFENPLLQSLGKQGADFMRHFSRNAEEVEKVERVSVETSGSGGKSAFQSVQDDLRQDNALAKTKRDETVADVSIQVHSCHSPMREVEVLYDRLLAVLDENPGLNPDDILIITPDIETYAPVIEAVFETPDEGQPEIPYSIADRGVQSANPGTEAFLTILELSESRFKVTDLLDLLDAAPVREAFGLGDDDLNRLEKWIRDNRIRWGVDGSFKRRMDIPESDSFTWKSGLNRMLLGYAMNKEDDRLLDGIFPYGEIATSDDAELAGKFSHLLRCLFEINEKVETDLAPKDWANYLNKIIDELLPDSRDYFREISQIRDILGQMGEAASLGGFGRTVPFRIVRSWLEDKLQQQGTGGGRIGRGVTFSSLAPMRGIPFKMVGMIGMNEGAFPRSEIPVEFDLIHLDPQPGDPIRATEDRYLFLENLLSARSHIYFSYVGQSNREDTDFPPSVVLREFLDYLAEYFGLKTKELIQKHRLQAFSPHYFTKDEYFSYSESQYNISRQLSESTTAAFFDEQLPEPEEEYRQLTVNNLISFYQHPAKYLLQKRLGIYLREKEVLTDDREPFFLDRLDEYKVGQELLGRFLKEQSLEAYEKVMRSRNMLPEGWSGEQAYREKELEVKAFGREIRQRLDQQQLEDCEVDLEIDGFNLVGTLPNVYEGTQMAYRFGKARPKDKIDWWIRHLLFQMVKPEDLSGRSMLFAWDDGSFEEYRLSPQVEAEKVLTQLLDGYWDGLQKPLPLYCKSSYAFAEAVINDGKSREEGIEGATKKWEEVDTHNYYRPGEGDDAYNKLVTGGDPPFDESAFGTLSRQFWMPFFNALRQEGD